jgi:hypothetical protein
VSKVIEVMKLYAKWEQFLNPNLLLPFRTASTNTSGVLHPQGSEDNLPASTENPQRLKTIFLIIILVAV